MRNLKKLVAFIVTLAMIATFAIPAFAAAPTDVVGTAYEGAVSRLVALGVINGYPDGTFGPEDSITRAQFAAIVVRALGYESLAATAAGITKFSDVAANHWGAGYINIAVSLGIIKGYGDGKFGPEDKVTFDQAVTMIVRALGQEAYAEAKGGFPTGYLLQANVIGFTAGVTGVAGVVTTRGIVAQLIDNAKQKPIYVQTGFGDSQTYEPTGGNFLGKLGMTEFAGVIVTQTPGNNGLAANTFVAGGTTYTAIAGTVDIESLLGKKVDLWGSAANKIVLAENAVGTAVAVKTVNDVTVTDGVYTVKTTLADGTAKDFTVAAGAGAMENLEVGAVNVVATDLKAVAADKVEISVVADGASLQYINAVKYGSATTFTSVTENKVVKWAKINTAAGSYFIKEDDAAIKNLVIKKDGAAIDASALAAGDVLFIAYDGQGTVDANDDILIIKATNQKVVGTLQSADSATAAKSIKVSGTIYTNSEFVPAGFDVSASLGKEVTLTLDPAGKVYSLANVTTAAVSADLNGVVLASDVVAATTLDDAVYKIKLLTAAGSTTIYTIANNADTSAYIGAAAFDANTLVGNLVNYHIASNGSIDLINATGAVGLTTSNLNITRMTFASKDVSSSVALFKNTAGVYSTMALADITNNAGDETASGYIASGSTITAIIINSDGYTPVSTAGSLSYVTGYVVIAGGYTVDMITKDGVKTYDTASAVAAAGGKLITYTLDSSSKMVSVKETADVYASVVSGDITAVGTGYVTIGATKSWFADNALVIYDVGSNGTGATSLTQADLYVDMAVTAYKNADGDIIALVVTAM